LESTSSSSEEEEEAEIKVNTHKITKPSEGTTKETRIVVIEKPEECPKAIKQIRKHKVFALDCEAVGMHRSGRLCLIQISTPDRSVYLFDLVPGHGGSFFDMGLRELFQSEKIVKIIHDCRGDSNMIYHAFQTKLENVFDTQVAFAVMSRQLGRPTPLPIGLNTLLNKYAFGMTNEFKEKARAEMGEDPNYWEKRPMTDTMIQYASQDVVYLPTLHKQIDAILSYKSRQNVARLSSSYVDQVRLLTDEEEKESETRRFVNGVPKYGVSEWDSDASPRTRRTTRR